MVRVAARAALWLLLVRGGSCIEFPESWQREHCVGAPLRGAGGGTVVALATDSTNQLPVMGVINSTLANARRPDAVRFVVVTRHVHALKELLDAFLPKSRVSICGGMAEALLQRPALRDLMRLGNSSRVKRKELLSPFNFAAFYLPHALDRADKILYLDTDVVVRGDVGELAAIDMEGFAAAAVEDCSQQVAKYVNLELLADVDAWGLGDRVRENGGACVFNRGVVLFDPARWRDLRLTETIEELVAAFTKSSARLWRGGISQPPFLLALAGRYLKLDISWNVRGLGRMDIGRGEWLLLAEDARSRYGLETSTFDRHVAPSGPFKRTFNPFFQPLAARAKILHFNGELKPWSMDPKDVRHWQLLGMRVEVDLDGVARFSGTCKLRTCATAVNVTTGRRLRSACEQWSSTATLAKSSKRWDQQHFSLDGERWSSKSLGSVGEYYASGCIARPPLCTCLSDLSDDCVTSCAGHWHAYVNADVLAHHARMDARPPPAAPPPPPPPKPAPERAPRKRKRGWFG